MDPLYTVPRSTLSTPYTYHRRIGVRHTQLLCSLIAGRIKHMDPLYNVPRSKLATPYTHTMIIPNPSFSGSFCRVIYLAQGTHTALGETRGYVYPGQEHPPCLMLPVLPWWGSYLPGKYTQRLWVQRGSVD